MTLRIGQGFDLHPFVSGRPLVLGGVTVPGSKGLKGHSDADALTHAVCDALLGALALGDMGHYFPDSDPKWKGKESSHFLKEISRRVSEKGYRVANVDTTLVTEEPILKEHVPEMRRNLASWLNVEVDQVSVKATRPEKLGALGRGEGLLAMASVLLERNS